MQSAIRRRSLTHLVGNQHAGYRFVVHQANCGVQRLFPFQKRIQTLLVTRVEEEYATECVAREHVGDLIWVLLAANFPEF